MTDANPFNTVRLYKYNRDDMLRIRCAKLNTECVSIISTVFCEPLDKFSLKNTNNGTLKSVTVIDLKEWTGQMRKNAEIRRIVGCYNYGDNQWLAYSIERITSSIIFCVYKDSSGLAHPDFVQFVEGMST